MNLEQLCCNIKNKYHLLKDKKKTFKFLRFQLALLRWKKQKLKLGTVTFDLVYFEILGIPLWQEVEMRYLRQDTSEDDAMKFENRLKALNWKWDFSNVGAFIIILSIVLLFSYVYLYQLYCEHLPTIAIRPKKYNEIIEFTFENIIITPVITHNSYFILANYWFFSILAKFCIEFGYLL